jgi:hypothetical protein
MIWSGICWCTVGFSIGNERLGAAVEVSRIQWADDDAVAFPAADGTTFKEFGQRWPFNLCGVWYFLGLIRLLGQGRPELAAQAFGAALRFGLALRCVLNAIGTEDLETAHLCREAEVARLSALARHDPSQALVAFEQILGNPGGLDPVTLEAHLQRARSRLFIDLVNLECYTAAKELIGSQELPIVEPMTLDGASAAFAWGLYLLNDEGETATASAVLARARQAAAAMLSSHPDDHETTRLFAKPKSRGWQHWRGMTRRKPLWRSNNFRAIQAGSTRRP